MNLSFSNLLTQITLRLLLKIWVTVLLIEQLILTIELVELGHQNSKTDRIFLSQEKPLKNLPIK
jgi:hypothetical protein